MLSNNSPLHDAKNSETLPLVSNDADLRDAGEPVSTTSAAPAGCRAYEAEQNADETTPDSVAEAEPVGCRADESEPKAEQDAECSVSVAAQGGSSDNSSTEPKTPADVIRSRRDFEAFLRNSGFSRATSKSIAAGGWHELAEVETDASEEIAADFAARLTALFRTSSPKKD